MEQILQPLYDLTQRTVPWLRPYVQFHLIPGSNGVADSFELYSKNKEIHITGTSVPAVSMGLNHYLKYYCHRSASHCGNNLEVVDPIPQVKNKVVINTPFQYRYALNYCTFNYTMSFWKWHQWEKELDWMALNGVNLMLVSTGTKAVWQNVLEQFGYSVKRIHEFIPGPVYNAWWLMGNIEGWGGLATYDLISQQVLLTQKILKRMRELNIQAVFPGFYGIVPRNLKYKFPGAPIVEQGKWNNVFDRPDILVCNDSLFKITAKAYYSVVEELYGDIKFFGGDPSHEGGSTEGLDVKAEAAAIQDAMLEAVPDCTWVLQAWYGNPKNELLEGLRKKENALILDLFGEVTTEWKDREAFGGIPFVWCSINNFGEKNGLYGRLEKIAAGPVEALKSKYRGYMKGVGAIPEGIANNPVVYDMIFDAAWRPEQFNVKEWLPEYTHYRYGKKIASIVQAWNYLLETAYSSSDKYQEGASESVFCARPSLKITSASTWATRYLYYDNTILEEAALLFLTADEELADQENYRYDLIDITRQVIANYGQQEYDELVKAYHHKNLRSFNYHSKAFLDLIMLMEDLLSTHPAFMVGRWLKEARSFRKFKAEKDICEWNARVLVTWWGPDNPNTTLRDYANKEWSGLIKDYYYPRWKFFLESLRWHLMGLDSVEINYFSFEKNWSNQRKKYPVKPSGDCVVKARSVLKKLEKYQNAPLVRR